MREVGTFVSSCCVVWTFGDFQFLNSTDELNSLETELGSIRDKLGTDQKQTVVPLRSAWEGIRVFII